MNKTNFPITPISDNVIIKITSQISVFQTETVNPIKDGTVISIEIVAVSDTVTKLKVGDNVIPRNVQFHFIKVNDNENSTANVIKNRSAIKHNMPLKKLVVEYAIISEMDILAIDNQDIPEIKDSTPILN